VDRIFSARVDDTVCREIGRLARELRTSKKAVIERAVILLGHTVEESAEGDVFAATCGAWKRKERPAQTAAAARKAFSLSMERYQR
jgi:predicted transcriptional regulator